MRWCESVGAKRQLTSGRELMRPGRRRLLKEMCSWAWDYDWGTIRRTWKAYRGTQYKPVEIGWRP